MTLALRVLAALATADGTFQPRIDSNMRAALEVDAVGALIKHLPRRLEVAKPITGSFGERGQALNEASQPNSTTMEEYEKLRFACVRLQATVYEEDLLKPWAKDKGKAVFVGSAFVVRNIETGPLVVTNAHVVNDAAELVMSIPANGQTQYRARPLLINHDMDIALVSLVSVEEYARMKADVGKDLPTVALLDAPPKLGAEVVAMGYPLGVTSVKITKGVLSGNEQVSEYMAYQQSAPISPGNSGGPLFLDGTNTVVGINFAAAAAEGAQAQNYAIPAFRVKQMLNQLDKAGGYYSADECKADRARCSFKLPGLRAQASPGSEEVYERYGCKSGIQITKAMKDSIFTNAEPPITAKTFITTINGVAIDAFGEAPAAEYFGDNVPFTEHMFMEPALKSVQVGTCSCGAEGEATVPLQFGGKLKEPTNVPNYDEVNLQQAHRDYEQFAGVTVQPLSVNLIQALVQEHQRLDLVQYMADPAAKPQLVVTAVDALGPAAQILGVGDVVDTVNGEKVHTLEDFRTHFEPKAGASSCQSASATGWRMESRGGRELVADFGEELEAAQKHLEQRPLTDAVLAALDSVKMAPSALSEGRRALPSEIVDGMSRRGFAELGELAVARPVEERTDVRRGGKRWDPWGALRQ